MSIIPKMCHRNPNADVNNERLSKVLREMKMLLETKSPEL